MKVSKLTLKVARHLLCLMIAVFTMQPHHASANNKWQVVVAPLFDRGDSPLWYSVAAVPESNKQIKNAIHAKTIFSNLPLQQAVAIARELSSSHLHQPVSTGLVDKIQALAEEFTSRQLARSYRKFLYALKNSTDGFSLYRTGVNFFSKAPLPTSSLLPQAFPELVDEELKEAIAKRKNQKIDHKRAIEYSPKNPHKVTPIKSKHRGRAAVLMVGDGGAFNRNQLAMVRAVSKMCKKYDCDIGVWLGDTFYEYGPESMQDSMFEWQFLMFTKQLDLDIYHILGNHEVGTAPILGVPYGKKVPRKSPVKRDARILVDRATHYPNRHLKMPALYYSLHLDFGTGSAMIHNLNTMGYNHKVQGDWLKKSIKESATWSTHETVWQSISGHHPIYSIGPHGTEDFLVEHLEPIFHNKADFYVAGHDHAAFILKKPDSKTIYRVIGNSSKVGSFDEESEASLPNGFQSFQKSESLGFGIVEYTQTNIVHRSFEVDPITEEITELPIFIQTKANEAKTFE